MASREERSSASWRRGHKSDARDAASQRACASCGADTVAHRDDHAADVGAAAALPAAARGLYCEREHQLAVSKREISRAERERAPSAPEAQRAYEQVVEDEATARYLILDHFLAAQLHAHGRSRPARGQQRATLSLHRGGSRRTGAARRGPLARVGALRAPKRFHPVRPTTPHKRAWRPWVRATCAWVRGRGRARRRLAATARGRAASTSRPGCAC